MRAFWSDPYLWVHLAGLAVVPIFLEVCLVGLAIGDPLLPAWVEILLVAIAGIAPILWMQWQRPFSIYSLVAVALAPSQLTDDQRRILKIFKSQESRILAAIAAVVLFLALIKLYALAPIATTIAPQLLGGRLTGLLVAAIAFLFVNLFVQVPVSVLRALAVSQTAFESTIPYPSQQVGRDFSLLGIGVKQILPPIVMEAPRPKPVPPAPVSEPSELRDALWDEPVAPTASLSEAALEEASAVVTDAIGELDLNAEPVSDIPNDDLADIWESSESVEEVAVRQGEPVVSDRTDDDVAAQSPQPDASEPAESWDESVVLPSDAQTEEAIADHPNPSELETLSEPLEVSPEPITADDWATDTASNLEGAPTVISDSTDAIGQPEAGDAEDTPAEREIFAESPEGSSSLAFEDVPEVETPPAEPSSSEPEALSFDELFDETKESEESSAQEPVETNPDLDSISPDLAPAIDDALQADPEHER